MSLVLVDKDVAEAFEAVGDADLEVRVTGYFGRLSTINLIGAKNMLACKGQYIKAKVAEVVIPAPVAEVVTPIPEAEVTPTLPVIDATPTPEAIVEPVVEPTAEHVATEQ